MAPKPRPALPSEKTYITSSSSGKPTSPRQLPCWHDRWLAERQASEQKAAAAAAASQADDDEGFSLPDAGSIEPAELRLSVVFPAYNEEDRIIPTLEEAVAWLDEHVGRVAKGANKKSADARKAKRHHHHHRPAAAQEEEEKSGYEILVVNDGSKDATVRVVLDFAAEHGLHDVLRVVSLERNRGKGGCVTHGMRHVRGEYILFADADGASRFSDVSRLIEGCEEVTDGSFRGVAIGSRAHLVGSEAVVKVCASEMRFLPR